MRKLLLSFAVISTLGTSAVTPEFLWGKSLFADNIITSTYDVQAAGDGSFFIAAGYNKGAQQLLWGDEKLDFIPSTATVDSSVLLLNVGSDGSVKWKIYSKVGNCKNFTGLASTADGGVVIAGIFRHNTADYTDEPLAEFIDANESVITVKGPQSNGTRRDFGIVAKITADGEIQWTQVISQSSKYDTQENISSAMTINAITADDKGNVFIGGRYLTELTLPGGTILPAGVNRPEKLSSSISSGDSWIAMLDSDDGETLATYCGSRDNPAAYASDDTVSGLDWENGILYFVNNIKGGGNTEMKLFGTAIPITSALEQPAYGAIGTSSVSSDGTFPEARFVNIVAPTTNPAGKEVLQINGFSAANGHIYITGAINGGLNLGNLSISSDATALKGFYLKASSENGDIVSSGILDDSISAICDLIDDHSAGKIYGLGYNLSKGYIFQPFTNGSVPTQDSPILLISGNGMFGIPAASFDGTSKQLVIGIRSNKQPSFYGTDTKGTDGISAYTASFAGYRLPGIESGIENISVRDENESTEYYNLQGIRVTDPSKGIYIVRRGTKVTKETIR